MGSIRYAVRKKVLPLLPEEQESMEKKTTRSKIDWRQFLVSVLGTAIGVALTLLLNKTITAINAIKNTFNATIHLTSQSP